MKKITFKNLWSEINPLTSRTLSPVLAVVYIVMAIFFYSFNPLFLTPRNYQAIFTNAPLIGIVALGVGAVLISGNVDISVGALVGVTSATLGILFRDTQLPAGVIIAIVISIGVTIGAINGFIINYIGVNSIITTLGMWAALKGFSVYLMVTLGGGGGGSIYIYNEFFLSIGRGFFFNVIPKVFLYMVILFVIMYLMARFTKFGRNLYLVGNNRFSAEAVGINVKLNKFLPFLISSGFAAFGGLLFTSQAGLAAATYGTGGFGGAIGWEFRALSMCIVAGFSFIGGRGTYVGLLLSFLILGSLSNGLTLINMPINWRDFFEGSILIFAIIMDSLRTRRKEIIT